MFGSKDTQVIIEADTKVRLAATVGKTIISLSLIGVAALLAGYAKDLYLAGVGNSQTETTFDVFGATLSTGDVGTAFLAAAIACAIVGIQKVPSSTMNAKIQSGASAPAVTATPQITPENTNVVSPGRDATSSYGSIDLGTAAYNPDGMPDRPGSIGGGFPGGGTV